MTPEEIYDAEIAPALLKIAQRCSELGFPMAASVEYAKGENGLTEFCPDLKKCRPSAKQLMVHYAARSKGNIDAMLMAVLKDARVYGHSSIYLKQLGCDNVQPVGNESAAFMITKG